MLKYVDFKVTFSEVPDEISLCISLSGCPHRCKGCHSSYLQKDIGEELIEETLAKMIKDNPGITCVCFMGGDNDTPALYKLAEYVKKNHKLRTAWYSGLTFRPTSKGESSKVFDYIKVGPYIEDAGPLTSKTTNQKMYVKGEILKKPDMSPSHFYDITYKFWNNDN